MFRNKGWTLCGPRKLVCKIYAMLTRQESKTLRNFGSALCWRVTYKALRQWHAHLHACVDGAGGHFEYKLKILGLLADL